MLKSTESDALSKYIGVQCAPEMLYGHNRLYIFNKEADILLSFTPVDSLRTCIFSEQQARFVDRSNVAASKDLLNTIDLIPEHIAVSGVNQWKKKDVSHIKDLTEIKVSSDWSFSSPYKGTIQKLSEAKPQLQEEVDFDFGKPEESKSQI